jgi:hydroxymethylbilane synthase
VLEGDRLWLRGLVADLEGRRLVRAQGRAPRAEAAALGRRVAEEVLESGGREILAQVYGEAPR